MKQALVPENELLIRTRAARMSLAPAGSEKTAVNVWRNPLPELGVTETGAGGVTTPTAVQAPSCAQALNTSAFCASRKTFLGPANAGVNVTARFSVNVFPDRTAEDAPTFKLHWLLDSVPRVPIVIGVWNAPASLSKYRSWEPPT